jgi:hypothetical protein
MVTVNVILDEDPDFKNFRLVQSGHPNPASSPAGCDSVTDLQMEAIMSLNCESHAPEGALRALIG